MGEEARRSGLDFERSIAGMLTQLGYQIVLENESLKCQTATHSTRSHGIDFLAKPVKPNLSRPLTSPNGLTVFSCKHASIGEAEIKDLMDTLECLKSSHKYNDVKGGILVTSSRVQRELQEKFNQNNEMYLWDQARCHLYGNLVRYYARIELKRGTKSRGRVWPIPNLDTIVTLILSQKRVGYLTLFDYYELGIFYEGNSRFNLDFLEGVLRELKRANVIPQFSLNRIIIHTTRGFTVDFSEKIDETVEKFISRSIGLVCFTSDLYDHGYPWFPSYIG
jgi:hypothetical protein